MRSTVNDNIMQRSLISKNRHRSHRFHKVHLIFTNKLNKPTVALINRLAHSMQGPNPFPSQHPSFPPVPRPCTSACVGKKTRERRARLPHVRPNEGVATQHGARLGIGQVSRGLAVDGQDEVAHAQTPVAADGAAVDDAAHEHPQAVLHRTHRHAWGKADTSLCLLRGGFRATPGVFVQSNT